MNHRILLVDDDHLQRKLCTAQLADAGYAVEAVACAADALAAARHARPDLIVSDVVMSDVDGFGLCRRVKDDALLAGIPVVLLSAHYGGQDNQDLAATVGASALVERTPTFTRELAVIDRCLRAGSPARARTTTAGYEQHLKSTNNQLIRVIEQTRSAERRLSAVVDQAHDAIGMLTTDGIILEVNQRWEELIGVPPAQMIGRHVREFAAPGEEASTVEGYNHIVAKRAGYELAVLRHAVTGATVYVEFSGRVIDVDGTPRVLSIGRNVTDRIEAERRAHAAEAERRALEARLAHAQKLDALGRLTGGIAHDFNNLLAVILTYSNLLSSDLADNDPRKADVLEIANAGQRAAALTRQLLAFSRRQMLELVDVDASATVTALARMLRRLIGEDIKLVINTASGATTRADASQLEQVIVNLVVNARDAMPDGGTMSVTTSTVEYGDIAEVPAGRYVMIEVADTGTGMDAETRRHMFEPFFTTKANGRGTGLGLSTSYGIVHQCGGQILVESEVGVGTVMKVLLPQVAPSASATERDQPAGVRGTETILLIEDDRAVRAALQRVLAERGFDVLAAAGVDDALAAVRTHDRPVELIISDVVMPHASGPETVARLATETPGARVLYISGYVDHASVEQLAVGSAFLHKPFTPDMLAAKAREMLTEMSCAS